MRGDERIVGIVLLLFLRGGRFAAGRFGCDSGGSRVAVAGAAGADVVDGAGPDVAGAGEGAGLALGGVEALEGASLDLELPPHPASATMRTQNIAVPSMFFMSFLPCGERSRICGSVAA